MYNLRHSDIAHIKIHSPAWAAGRKRNYYGPLPIRYHEFFTEIDKLRRQRKVFKVISKVNKVMSIVSKKHKPNNLTLNSMHDLKLLSRVERCLYMLNTATTWNYYRV